MVHLKSASTLHVTAAVVVFCCYLVTVTEQTHLRKYRKSYGWDDSPKYVSSYPTIYNSKPSLAHHHYVHEVEKPVIKPDRCELRKVVFTQDSESPQYIVYKTKIPDLKEFTLCHWHNIFNYTHDQPIFSYSQPGGKSRVIYSWIENSPEKTYYSLAINGHTIYRINYPEKLFKWYHVCQSWNGHTGEWQLWINSERVGRGFYNLMVGKIVKGGGVAISGREYLEQALAVHHPAYSGELLLVSLYKAALTAGKAYNNHKHHHVHNFHHGYDESVDEAETEEPPQLPSAPEPTLPPHLAHGGPFSNGQLVPKLPVKPVGQAAGLEDEQLLFDGGLYDFYSPYRGGVGSGPPLPVDETFRVNLLDEDDRRYKRNATKDAAEDRNRRPKRWTPLAGAEAKSGGRTARSDYDRRMEPAQWEVSKVSSVCEACQVDPFGTASVLSWHDTRKQFYNGALYVPALPKCYLF